MDAQRLLKPLLVLLLVVILLSTLCYIKIMYRMEFNRNSIVDGLYFSVQTITTVGYGDWKPSAVQVDESQVFLVKILSLPTMLGGASLFAAAVAVAVEWLRQALTG